MKSICNGFPPYFSGIFICADMPNFVGQIQNITVFEGAKQVSFTCTVNKIGSHMVVF